MKPVDEPSERYFRAQVIQAVVSMGKRRYIIEELPDPRYNLQKEDYQGGTAEYIGIAGASGHFLFQGQADEW